ncbi:MAG: MmgE/PrpD family protein, partial [Pseudolabrys sp.]
KDVVALSSKVRYVIDPDNPYPNNFTGHIRAVLNDGTVVEERQAHFRGGVHEPLSRADIE